jgi:hypothetical protein
LFSTNIPFQYFETNICPRLAGLRLPSSVGSYQLEAGEIIESISAPNPGGRVLMRHNGRCYRAWKEGLSNSRTAERLRGEIFSGPVEHSCQ